MDQAYVTYTPLALRPHHSLARDPGMSLTFPMTFIRLFLWLLVYLCAPPFVFVLTFSGPLQSPRSCIVHPRGRQSPSSVLPASQQPDFHYLSPSHTVSPTHCLRLLSCGAEACNVSSFLVKLSVCVCVCFPPFSVSSKTITQPDVLRLREKGDS